MRLQNPNPKGGKLKIINFDRLKPFPSSTDVRDVRQTDENTPTTYAPLIPQPVIGSGAKLLDSSGDVTDDESENPHEGLPAIGT